MAEGQPPFQVLPPLDPFDLARLRESIAEHGVREPIVVDENGDILDGHYRKMLANELGCECPERVISGLTEQEKRAFALTANAARRQLTISQRREVWQQHRGLIEAALTTDARRSDRSIADEVGTHHATVAKVRESLEENGGISILERRGREEPHEPSIENYADHRNDMWFELTIGYAAESVETRTRKGLPYPQASERLEWHTGRRYLTTETPRSLVDFDALIIEQANTLRRLVREQPLKTMLAGVAS